MRLLQGIVAQGMGLSLRPAMGLTVRNFYRIAPEIAPLPVQEGWEKEQVVPLGEWMGADPQVFLAELVLPPLSPGKLNLLHLSFTYRLPRERTRQELRYDLRLPCVAGQAGSPLVPEKVRRALEKVMAYRLQESAWQDAGRGNIEQATRRLQAAATRLIKMGETQLAQVIEEEARRMQTTGRTSSVGKKEIRYGTQRLGRGWSGRTQEKRG
jgi:hypothetical protein